MKKILGIFGLFAVICLFTALEADSFTKPNNIANLASRTGLYGVLGIGVAFVIVTGGIDLSIGSIVGLTGTLLPWLIIRHGWSVPAALGFVALVSIVIGLFHGLLITRLNLQPFLVTLCGLLIYRSIAQYVTDDQNQGFGTEYTGLRDLATGSMGTMATLMTLVGAVLTGFLFFRYLGVKRSEVAPKEQRPVLIGLITAGALTLVGLITWLTGSTLLAEVPAPMPFWILVVVAMICGLVLNDTVFGRHLLALGRNEQAARFSGVRTTWVIIAAYVICAVLAGLGGVLFTCDLNGIQPATLGQVFELYAIAAAVLGGCSLRGGECTILGIVIGTAVLRLLLNAFNLLGTSYTIESAVMGTVILLGVLADEVIRRFVRRRRRTAG
ncbi:MAG: ABC transporter permease [Planctomycetota bacterium]